MPPRKPLVVVSGVLKSPWASSQTTCTSGSCATTAGSVAMQIVQSEAVRTGRSPWRTRCAAPPRRRRAPARRPAGPRASPPCAAPAPRPPHGRRARAPAPRPRGRRPPCGRRSARAGSSRARSPPAPHRVALLEEGLDALLDVLGREGDRQLRAQEVDGLEEGHVLLAEHRVLA